jgi:hypothetical protein
MMEEWRDIPGYEGLYKVSDLGRVLGLKRGRVMNGSKRRRYVSISLRGIGFRTYEVHQLVAMAFLNHSPCGYKTVVDHINNNGLDNRLCNLQVVTQRLNASKDRKGKSIYTGVSWHKSTSKWIANIRIDKKQIYLGSFDDELLASKSYQDALKKYNLIDVR